MKVPNTVPGRVLIQLLLISIKCESEASTGIIIPPKNPVITLFL